MHILLPPPGVDIRPQSDQHNLSYGNLLQELLLSLVGFSGDVIVTTGVRPAAPRIPAPDQCDMSLSADLEWVQAPDRVLIDSLVRLGFHYEAIRSFIDNERASVINNAARLVPPLGKTAGVAQGGKVALPTAVKSSEGSVYRQALASGLTEALDVFQAAVLAVQSQVMSSPHSVVLSSLHHQLHEYKSLLPQLHDLVYKVSGSDQPISDLTDPFTEPAQPPGAAARTGPLSGAAVLTLLTDLSRSGLPALQSCVQRLLWHCNQALHKQLASWMVYGQLNDPYCEFFVVPNRLEDLLKHGIDQAEYERITGLSQLPPPAQPQGAQGGAQDFNFRDGFIVVPRKLPPCISLDTAFAVQFVGKSVKLLDSPAGDFRGRQLMPYQDTLHAAQVLSDLQASPTFDRAEFERCVTALRTKVAALLWQLVVQQAGLMTHLTAMKDYYLLAKGEFIHAFLGEAKRLLALPPRPISADAELSIPWQQAALKSSAQDDPLFPNFRLRWGHAAREQRVLLPSQAQVPANMDVPSYDGNWDGLWIEAAVEWPVGLILTAEAVQRYNAVFMMLLRTRRVELALEEAWVTLSERSKCAPSRRKRMEGSLGADPLLTELQCLRHYMAHIVTNLQIYMQVDVIETQFSLLEENIAASQDFTEVERAHTTYLHAVAAQCFLTTKTMSLIITSVFRHVADLCQLIDAVHRNNVLDTPPSAVPTSGPLSGMPGALGTRTLSSDGPTARAQALERARSLSSSWKQVIQNLYTTLNSTSLVDANKATHLRQLYMRLNYNNFLTKVILGHRSV